MKIKSLREERQREGKTVKGLRSDQRGIRGQSKVPRVGGGRK